MLYLQRKASYEQLYRLMQLISYNVSGKIRFITLLNTKRKMINTVFAQAKFLDSSIIADNIDPDIKHKVLTLDFQEVFQRVYCSELAPFRIQ